MAGLITGNMQEQPPGAGQGGSPQGPPMSDEAKSQAVEALTPAAVSAQIKVDPQFQQAFQRVVEAGGRFLFDEKTHQYAIKALETGEGASIGEKLGNGIAGLMSLLIKKSNATIPPQVVLPAALELLTQAVDFIQQSGMDPVSSEEFGLAIRTLTTVLMQAFGADPKKMDEVMGRKGAGGEEPPQPGREGETTSEEVAEPPAGEPAPPEGGDDFPEEMTKKG